MKRIALSLAGVFACTAALAQVVTVPPGLSPGEPYRLVFITKGATTALSPNIADYDAFVTSQANQSALLAALRTTWHVIGSTAAVSAKAHTSTDDSPAGPNGVPIYRLDGALIASSYDDLWDGTIQNPLYVAQDGSVLDTCCGTWTGTNVQGVGIPGDELGAPDHDVVDGAPNGTESNWIQTSPFGAASPQFLYAISDVLAAPGGTIIEVRLKVGTSGLTTCGIPCDENEHPRLGNSLWVTFAYDTGLAGPDREPLDPGLGAYGGNMGVGASVRLEGGDVPFSFSCGLVDGKMTATPCTESWVALYFVDASMTLDPNHQYRDTLWLSARFAADGKYLEFNDHAWRSDDDGPFLDGDSVTQLPLPRPNFPIGFGSASLVDFGSATRWFEDESSGSSENSVTRDAGSPGLTLSKSLVAGCKGVTGWVTLSAPAPVGGTVVTLSDTLASTTTPATVTIREGTTSNYFTISTTPVATNQDGMVTASLGSKSSDRPLTVRPMGLSAVKLSPTTVVGGHDATGTAMLECRAGPGPITVDLSTSNAAVAHPVAPTVVVPQGLSSQTFTVATNPVLDTSNAMITGEASTTTKSRRLKVVPAATVSPTRLAFGSVSVGQTSGALSTILRNNGVVPFAVTGINLTGTYASWFGQTNNCPANLAAGASCTITVRFTPQAALSKSAKLIIATSATSTPLSVSLSGTGI